LTTIFSPSTGHRPPDYLPGTYFPAGSGETKGSQPIRIIYLAPISVEIRWNKVASQENFLAEMVVDQEEMIVDQAEMMIDRS
jgi:hypothetical protein